MVKLSLLCLLFFPIFLFSQASPIVFKALPGEINTIDFEELGRWTLDGKAIIFSRLMNDHSELLMAHVDSLGKVIAVDNLQFGAAYRGGGHAISPDEKTMVFTICNGRENLGDCDLYQSHWLEGKWSPPENLGRAYNGARWEGQPAYGLDGQSIFFASTRQGGYGGSDIWMVRQISPGILSNPINAGPEINTANNEGSPFIHFDGRTIYFMRDGNDGYGGFDLYFSQMGIDGKWKPASNMGPSINSGANEGGLAIHPNGKTAMITRSTPTQQNNLYEFNLPVEFQSSPIQALYVNVKDEVTGKPVHARLEILDVNGNDTIRLSQQADEKGNITVTLDRNKSFGLIASANGYIMHSSNLEASKEAVRKLDIRMIPLSGSLKKTIALQNIFFGSGSSLLLPSSKPELNKLVQMLQTNASMTIEIRGHTDNVGTDESNMKLSEARAKSVYQFLIDKGIDVKKLSYKGFGETKPLAGNDTEKGRRQNRRTEFFIVKI